MNRHFPRYASEKSNVLLTANRRKGRDHNNGFQMKFLAYYIGIALIPPLAVLGDDPGVFDLAESAFHADRCDEVTARASQRLAPQSAQTQGAGQRPALRRRLKRDGRAHGEPVGG